MWNRKLISCATALKYGRPAAGSAVSLRCLCAPLDAVPSALSLARRCFSSDEVADEEVVWTKTMANKYGPGNYQLFRPLYKDLCDEIRREYYTKPPPPPVPVVTNTISISTTTTHPDCAAAASPEESSSSAGEEEGDKARINYEGVTSASGGNNTASNHKKPLSHVLTPPVPEFGDGTWSVKYRPEHNVVTFHRAAVQEGRLGEVHAWCRIELKDPPRLNAVLTFADWIPIEVCVERNGVMIHFSMASNEGGMHMRNVRVYAPTSAEEKAALIDPSEDGDKARKKLYYDGPCLWHLELDFQNELYDVMQDHGISLDWVHWAASWVFYLEHVNYVRWNLGILEELIPSPLRGPESDYLSEAERALLEEPVEDWLEAHSI